MRENTLSDKVLTNRISSFIRLQNSIRCPDSSHRRATEYRRRKYVQQQIEKELYSREKGNILGSTFVSGVVKLQRNEELSIKLAEKNAAATFKLDEVSKNGEYPDGSVLERIAKIRKIKNLEPLQYTDVKFISENASICEGLWSLAKSTYGPIQQQKAPILLETLLFLKVNSIY